MGMMNVEVPDGATIQVFVGKIPLVGACGTVGASGEVAEVSPAAPAAPRHKSHPVVTALAAIAILGGGFLLGQHARLSQPARAAQSAGVAAPPPVTQAFPDHALPKQGSVASSQASAAEVPSDFSAQLQQKPTVVPPPGKTASVPHKNPFGLGD